MLNRKKKRADRDLPDVTAARKQFIKKRRLVAYVDIVKNVGVGKKHLSTEIGVGRLRLVEGELKH